MHNSLFLGPHGENAGFFQQIWGELLERTLAHRRNTFADDDSLSIAAPDPAQVQAVTQEIEQFFAILQKEVPTFSNRYLGHMISDVSIPALIGNAAVLFCNPNLASREVASAGVQFETQAINELAAMIGFEPVSCRGHFTSGGTVANFEAFWRARFRLDHWLSLAAWLLENHLTGEDIFQLAHLGWERFDEHRERHVLAMAELAERSYVIQGPWNIASYYRETLGRDFPQPVVLVPGNKHYSWPKAANIFGLGEQAIWPTELDRCGRVSISSLRANIDRARQQQRPIMMAVSVAGTTELGTVDAVDEACELFDEYRRQENIDIWHHVDAAYGGYFCSTFRGGPSQLPEHAVRAFSALARADSVTLDPHKLGFVPYACGAFLVREPRAYSVSRISAPYLVEDTDLDHPGWSTTLEGSRSATGAGAVWLSSRVLPLDATGHGAVLNQTLATTRELVRKLERGFDNIYFTPGADTNIVCFTLAARGSGLRDTNRATARIIEQFNRSPHFAISRTALGTGSYRKLVDYLVGQWGGTVDDDHLLVIRMVVMSPYLGDAAITGALLDEFVAELKRFSAPA